MGLDQLPQFIRDSYEVHEWKHACAILQSDFPNEWADLVAVLTAFRWKKSWVTVGGGRRSKISEAVDGALLARGWVPKNFDTEIHVDGNKMESPTHEVDCFKNGVALETEWNNKDPFYDRDLNNFRLLFDLRVVSVGVIITRKTDLGAFIRSITPNLVSRKYGASTTHMGKLLPRVRGGGGGGCPLLVFGISKSLYVDDTPANVPPASNP